MRNTRKTDGIRDKHSGCSTKSQDARLTIGFLTHGVSGHSIAEVARERDVNLIRFESGMLRSPYGFESQGNVLFDLVDPKIIDGLIVNSGALCHYSGVEKLQEFCERYQNLPIVSLEVSLDGYPCVLLDFYQGMRDVIVHLLEVHGYRRIAFIRGPEESQTGEERYRAYVDTLNEYDIPFDMNLVVPGTFFPPSGAEAVRLLLDERNVSVEAIVAANDFMALDALQTLESRGIQVPDDIAVVGFDDLKETRAAISPLTTAQLQAYDRERQAAEMLLALLEGEEVPEQVILPVRLVVRQSCGCSSPTVVQAAVGQVMVVDGPFETIFPPQRERILAEIAQVVKAHGCDSEWVKHLLDSFAAEMEGTSPGTFLMTLEGILRKMGGAGTVWNDVLSALRRHMRPYLGDVKTLSLAEDLWQQARTLIGEEAERVQAHQSIQIEQQFMRLQEIGQALISTFDVQELMNILARELPRLGIPSCYLSLYEDPNSLTEWARLMLAYNEEGRIELGTEGQRFPSSQLVPAGMLPRYRHYTMVVEALYFRENQLGFILFEEGAENFVTRLVQMVETLYKNPLRGEISSALQGALLVQQVREHTAELAREQYILDTFMANVPDYIYFKDRDGRITNANMAHARKVGFNDPSEEIGKTDFDFFPEELARPKYEQEQEVLHTGQPLINLEEPDAWGSWSFTTKMPLRDEGGNIIGIFGISRDITALKQTQAALERAYDEVEQRVQERTAELSREIVQRRHVEEEIRTLNAELEQRVQERTANLEAVNKELKEFAFIVSHDLKAPLRGIAHLASWLSEDYEGCLDEAGQEMISLLTGRVKHLDSLIDGILRYSKVGRTDMEEEAIDLNQLVHRVIESLSLPGHIQVIIHDELPVVHCNQTRIAQLFQNLLSNAVKFLDKPYGEITIGCQDSGESWLFHVADNGAGIEERFQEKIFRLFQTGTTQDQSQSTGIGLALVKKIVEFYGGRIWVESTVGEGSVFWFTLPKT